MRSLLWHEIRSRRNALIGWSIGLWLFGMMYTTVYPSVAEQFVGLAELELYQVMGVNMQSFEGYFGSTVVGFLPILLGIYAVLTSTAALAGEEDEGTLELLLTTRLKRHQIVTAKALALLIVTTLILTVAALGYVFNFSLIESQIETTVRRGDVFVVVLSALPLVWALLMVGLWAGAALPNRRSAMAVGLIVLVVSYFGKNLGGMLDGLAWLKTLSLFNYFDTDPIVFSEGPAVGDVALLLTVALVAFGLAQWAFARRDVTVGNWPWQRARPRRAVGS